MPVIQYPQLENELFCNIYYLRHLCDQQRFPDWPIKEPVGLELHTISSHQYMTSLSSLSLPSLPSFPPSLSPFPPSLSPFPLSLPFSPFPLSLPSLPSLSTFPLYLLSLPSLSSPQVKLLKDVLEEWKREVEKKPPEMSVDQAYDTLGLPTGVGGSVVVFVSHSQDTQ